MILVLVRRPRQKSRENDFVSACLVTLIIFRVPLVPLCTLDVRVLLTRATAGRTKYYISLSIVIIEYLVSHA